MKKYTILILLLSLSSAYLTAQKRNNKYTLSYDTSLYSALSWRSIGPYRGGRSAAVTGVSGKPNLFYMGTCGGGVWRTRDGGNTWHNISDGFFGGSIGSVAVAASDHNVIYAGGGEVTLRGNVSFGYGIWKSTDAGDTWRQSGLSKSRHIPRICIHPDNPDIVYAAVLGDLFKASDERGVYRSKNGGKTWDRILFANENSGAVDLVIDPVNPRILFASTWNVRRTPYSLSSGGAGSALWKSTDGGDHWEKLNDHKGFPKGPTGIIGVSVSAVDNHRIYAIIEAPEGGVFRSDDGGKTWQRTNSEHALRQRAWYYSRIYADPQILDRVYVMNVSYHVSNDGGRTFQTRNAPHGDHHDLWIAPEDNQRMIIADDGGGQISFDAGNHWSTYMNQPTAQFYRVTTDNHFPYRIYGAQQDNSAIRINHRSEGWSIGEHDWESTAGGESAYIAVNPLDDDEVFGGSYDGFLSYLNHRTRERRIINVWPDNPLGHGVEDMKYRFQWNFPLFFSPNNPHKLYAASNHLHVSYNAGQSWKTISPDLTRNDTTKQQSSGGPITQDNTSVEYYCTIFSAAESPYEKDLIWTGSDDGLVYITRDGGEHWENVTPPTMPAWMMINSIEIDPFHKGGMYFAGTRYKLGDYAPYLYKTEDYGKSWKRIVNGIPDEHFTRVVRADPGRKGLLYCGTESGMYISFDDGASWNSFQLNLPIVPITDLAIKNNNLIAATQGRAFWMIDDLSVLHQLGSQVSTGPLDVFEPLPVYLIPGYATRQQPVKAGKNHANGLMLFFCLKESPDSIDKLSIGFFDSNAKLIKRFAKGDKKSPLKLKKGSNEFIWNMRYPDAENFEGNIMWWASTQGPLAVPGHYFARFIAGNDSLDIPFEILGDPRSSATQADYQAQFDFLIKVRDKLSEIHLAIREIRNVRKDLNELKSVWKNDSSADTLISLADTMIKQMTQIEKALYQTQNRSNQDPLNFPIRLNNKLAHAATLAATGHFGPTDQSLAFYEDIVIRIDRQLNLWKDIKDEDIPAFNQLVHQLNLAIIKVRD